IPHVGDSLASCPDFQHHLRAPALDAYSRDEWEAYFDAVATGLIAQPHTARRRANDMARLCPYADVAAAGLARVKAAIEAYIDMVGPKDRAKWH
ncbi:hypothetical protein, partial [Methylobacterium sp. BTF04]|uniref:hypothetical protein n=1 Tax=Methylobacterium sp. BTF04 TaxID=2708300 RepID=UPI00195353E0